MTIEQKVNIVTEALIKEGLVEEIGDSYNLTFSGKIKVSKIICEDFDSMMNGKYDGHKYKISEGHSYDEALLLFTSELMKQTNLVSYLIKHYYALHYEVS